MPDSGSIGFMENETNQSADFTLLLEKLRKESLEKSLLLEISKNINSSLNLDEVLHLILESLNQVIPYDAAGIFLVDSKTNRLIPQSILGYDDEALKLARLKVGKGILCVATDKNIQIGLVRAIMNKYSQKIASVLKSYLQQEDQGEMKKELAELFSSDSISLL